MDTPNNAADAATADVRPEAKEGSEIATAPAAQTGQATPVAPQPAPGERLIAQLGGDTPAAKIDALHARHFAGSRLGQDTEMWNLVMAFAADVKRVIEELGEAVEKL